MNQTPPADYSALWSELQELGYLLDNLGDLPDELKALKAAADVAVEFIEENLPEEDGDDE